MLALVIIIQPMLRFRLKERTADLDSQERRRVTLQETAEATGLNRITLSKIANHHGANVQAEAIERLCVYFDCRVEDLIEHVPDAPNDGVGLDS